MEDDDNGGQEAAAADARRLCSRRSLKKLQREIEEQIALLNPMMEPPGDRSDETCGAAAERPPVAQCLPLKGKNARPGQMALLVPTASKWLGSFDPTFWTRMDPKCFVYGDGVYAIERKVN